MRDRQLKGVDISLAAGWIEVDGRIWRHAVDMLLDLADLVVFDLSGMLPANGGVRYEMQRVVDRFPVERVIFLADRSSDRRYLRGEVEDAWRQMAPGSPNSGLRPKVARLAVTDYYRPMQRPQGESTYVYYRLVAWQWQSRRLAAELNPDQRRSRPLGLPPRQTAGPDRLRVSGIAVWAAQLVILTCCALLWVSVTVLTGYVKNNGGETLLTATNSDSASPLHPLDFKILIVLAALAFVITVISMLSSRPSLTAGTGIASLGLIAYTVYIPSEGIHPGFGPYGSSYWLSLAAAIVIALSSAVTVIAGFTRSA